MAAYFLQRLNRIIDRLFGFELQAEELQYLADARKANARKPIESVKMLDAPATLSGLR